MASNKNIKALEEQVKRLQQDLKELTAKLKVPQDETDRIYFWLGRAVQKKRTERGIQQEHLADVIGMRRTSIANIEAGKQRAPIHIWMQLCQHLNISFSDLIEHANALADDWAEAHE